MKNTQLRAIKQKHTNATLRGSNFEGVADLPITRTEFFDGQPAVLSVWSVPFWSRFNFLFDGRVNFVCYGYTHPPVSITVGEYFETINDSNVHSQLGDSK